MKHYHTILFDLDGTLLDTSKGVFGSVRYAQQKMGFPPLPEARLQEFVGPPPVKSYQKIFGVDEASAQKAAAFHREYGKIKGILEAEHYPGMKKLLETLKNSGKKIGVATLKREDIAKQVLKNFELFHYFDTVVGIDQGESLTKADTIRIALQRMEESSKQAVLIGDSLYDAVGAREAGIDFIGVTYGFGFHSKEEIIPYPGAESVFELQQLLLL